MNNAHPAKEHPLPMFLMHFTLFCEKYGLFAKIDGGPKPNIHGSALVNKYILRALSTSRRRERKSGTRRSTLTINQMQQAWGAVPISVFKLALDASPLRLS
jgi:hypothetical protein